MHKPDSRGPAGRDFGIFDQRRQRTARPCSPAVCDQAAHRWPRVRRSEPDVSVHPAPAVGAAARTAEKRGHDLRLRAGLAARGKRLTGIEIAADPVSRDVLSRLGLGTGWRCAEVGAGGGSIALWLAGVGDTGQVGRYGPGPGHLIALEAPNLQVLQHDLTAEDPPAEPFDLVHTRLVIEHLADPEDALTRLMGWIGQGAGWW